MKQILLALLLNCLTLLSQGEIIRDTLKPEIQKIIDTFQRYGGFYYGNSYNRKQFEEFKLNLNNDELIELTGNYNPVIRCYSALALAQKKEIEMFSILKEHLHDSDDVYIIFGDEAYHQKVGDLIHEIVTTNAYINTAKITKDEKHIIDSLLIFDQGIDLNAKSDLLLKIEPKETYYDRIRQIALTERNNNAIVALSKFQKAQDIPLIIDLLNNPDTDIQYLGLRAVRSFPDSSFFPFIRKIHATEIKKTGGISLRQISMLYQAIVMYKNLPSKKLLLKSIAKAKLDDHIELIWVAIKKYPDPIYDDILPKLKIKDYRFDELKREIYWD